MMMKMSLSFIRRSCGFRRFARDAWRLQMLLCGFRALAEAHGALFLSSTMPWACGDICSLDIPSRSVASAVSVRLRRWVERLFMLAVPAGSVYLLMRYHMGVFGFLVTCICLYAAGFGIWILSGMPKRWAQAGIEILNGWSSKDRRLAFAKLEYEKAFVALNQGAKRR